MPVKSLMGRCRRFAWLSGVNAHGIRENRATGTFRRWSLEFHTPILLLELCSTNVDSRGVANVYPTDPWSSRYTARGNGCLISQDPPSIAAEFAERTRSGWRRDVFCQVVSPSQPIARVEQISASPPSPHSCAQTEPRGA